MFVEKFCCEQVNKAIKHMNLIRFLTVIKNSILEGRRYGKTIILAKNMPESSSEDEDDQDGDDSDSDQSMNEGYPAKKPRIS